MRLSIRHTTRYNFSQPVVHALQRLRLTPKETQGQQILNWNLDFTNAQPELEYDDQHFNTVTLIAVEPGVSEVIVTCSGEVQTENALGVIGRHSGHLPLWSFLGHTKTTKPGPKLRALLRDVDATLEDGELAYLDRVSAHILDQVAYETGKTDVGTHAEDAIAAGHGVCQDHAHIFISAARLAGLPARYVSGYLMMDDRIEQDATHAWAEAYVAGMGWVGFDISNGIRPDDRYVRVATGRDYKDAAPITGISFGSLEETLTVDVAVEQQQQQDQGQQQEQQ
ncbi:MAG: transglutaminase family protein [Pseudomonadota bacterium]